jgi:putative NADPH-quinone reductase
MNEERAYKILVVMSHPCPESYNAVIAQTFVDSAINIGHDVLHGALHCTLYINDVTQCYRPNMSRLERENYFALLNPNDVASEVEHLIELWQWCDTLVYTRQQQVQQHRMTLLPCIGVVVAPDWKQIRT